MMKIIDANYLSAVDNNLPYIELLHTYKMDYDPKFYNNFAIQSRCAEICNCTAINQFNETIINTLLQCDKVAESNKPRVIVSPERFEEVALLGWEKEQITVNQILDGDTCIYYDYGDLKIEINTYLLEHVGNEFVSTVRGKFQYSNVEISDHFVPSQWIYKPYIPNHYEIVYNVIQRNLLVYDDNAEPGEFTKRLMAIIRVTNNRNHHNDITKSSEYVYSPIRNVLVRDLNVVNESYIKFFGNKINIVAFPNLFDVFYQMGGRIHEKDKELIIVDFMDSTSICGSF